MLNNIKIGPRLGIGFFIILFVLISLVLFAIWEMTLLSEQTTLLYNHPLTVSNAVLRINANITKMHRSMKDVVLSQTREDIVKDATIVSNLEKNVLEDFKVIDKRFLGEKGKYQKALATFVKWKPIRDEVIALMIKGEREKAVEITRGKGALHVIRIEDSLNALGAFAQLKAREFLNTATDTTERSLNTMYYLLFLSVFLTIGLAIIIAKSITKPLAMIKTAVNGMTKGEMKTRIGFESKDELGALAGAFNKMKDSLAVVTASRDELDREIAERRKVEELLRDEETFTALALNAQTDTFFVFDPDTGKPVRWNKAFRDVSGYSDEEIASMNAPADWYAEEDLEKAAKASAKIFETGHANIEMSLITKDGEKIPTEYAVSLIRDGGGEPLYMISIGRDITKRRKAQEALKASETRFHQAIMDAPYPVMIHADDSEVVLINKAWTDITGYTSDEIQTVFDWTEKAYGKKKDEVKAYIDGLYKLKQRRDEGEWEVITKNGLIVIWDFVSVPLEELPDGRKTLLTMAVDVTERKKGEETLRQYEKIIFSASDLLAFVDGGYMYRAASNAYCQAFNKKPESIVGHHASSVLGEQYFHKVKPSMDKCLGGETVTFQTWLEMPRLGSRFLNVSYSPHYGLDGKVEGIVVSGTDITELKKYEDSLKQFEKIVSTSNDFLAFIDKDFIYREVNEPYFKAFGLNREDIVGHKVSELIGERHFNDTTKPRITKCLAGEAFTFQTWFDFPQTAGRFMDVSYIPYIAEDKTVAGCVVCARDITELKQADDEKSLLLHDLGKRVKELRCLYGFSQMIETPGITLEEIFSGLSNLIPKSWQYPEITTAKIIVNNEEYLSDNYREGQWRQTSYIYVDAEEVGFIEVHYLEEKPEIDEGPFMKEERDLIDALTGRIGKHMERRNADKSVLKSLQEKEVLLREIHHRVKNNLATISALLEMQSGYIENEEARQIFTDSQGRIKSIALVHELLYQTDDFTNINVKSFIQRLCSLISITYAKDDKVVRLHTDIPEITLDLDELIPIGLILNEAITNAYKYGFPGRDGGEVHIGLTSGKAGLMTLKVRDNGVGLPQGFDYNKSGEFGYRLIRLLSRQIKGQLDVKSTDGVEITITWKKAQ